MTEITAWPVAYFFNIQLVHEHCGTHLAAVEQRQLLVEDGG